MLLPPIPTELLPVLCKVADRADAVITITAESTHIEFPGRYVEEEPELEDELKPQKRVSLPDRTAKKESQFAA